MAAKSSMLVRKTLTLTTLSMCEPAASRMAERFLRHCSYLLYQLQHLSLSLSATFLVFPIHCSTLDFLKDDHSHEMKLRMGARLAAHEECVCVCRLRREEKRYVIGRAYRTIPHIPLYQFLGNGIHSHGSRAVDHSLTFDGLAEEGHGRGRVGGGDGFFLDHFGGCFGD